MIRTSALLAFFTVSEGATGLLLIAAPSVVTRLLFAVSLDAGGMIMGRLAGIALFALAFACWMGRNGAGLRALLAGMLAFNALATGYLVLLGFAGGPVGVLLWPMVALHAAMTILTAQAWLSGRTRTAPARDRPSA